MIGSLLIDKPAGITSHDAVDRIRRAIRARRVGHAGTLDPFATGLLVICVGKATRLVRYLADLEKEYIATVRLGFATDTQDLAGKQTTPLAATREITGNRIRQVLREFEGEQLQTPPMFSAKKVRGERLYKAARGGREVEREAVRITISGIELIESEDHAVKNADGTDEFVMRVRCSSGTYIRTLAHDIGTRLGVGAHLAALRRTRVGCFDLSRSLTLDEVDVMSSAGGIEAALLSPSDTLGHLPEVRLTASEVVDVANGRALELSASDVALYESGESLRLCDGAGKLLAVGEYDPTSSTVRPRVVLGVEACKED